MTQRLLQLSFLVASIGCPMRSLAQDIPSEEVGDTGSITFSLQGVPVNCTLVRGADGHVWLQQNLGSTGVGTAANDASAYGHLYQWGRWSDGHALRTGPTGAVSALPANDPSGLGAGSVLFLTGNNPADWWGGGSDADTWMGSTASATNGIDPCTALGEGWQLPDREDWVTALADEGITNATTAFASNLKLVMGGSREGVMGNLINVGGFANYWSRTPNTLYAKNLTIGGDFVNPEDDALRSYGMSVRCLNKDLHASIPDAGAVSTPRIYPVPSTGEFTVDAGTMTIRTIRILTTDGRLFGAVPVRKSVTTLNLPMGVYHLQLDTDAGTIRRSVVIVP